ncbi:MAG: hypothetical protein IPK85_02955 [Gemmatimonadetes bacterium]|nr:hypothetical protein [Gemmatimonadota bacterium]
MNALAGYEVRSTPVSLPLTSPLRVRPVGGGSEVTLCRGSEVTVRVVRPCDGGPALFGLAFRGRAFLASPDALVAATDAVAAPAPAAPAPAAPAPADDFPLNASPVGWEPRHQVRPGASPGPRFRAPKPRRAGAPTSADIAAAQRRSPLWAWRASSS